jgi:hypothetical protein
MVLTYKYVPCFFRHNIKNAFGGNTFDFPPGLRLVSRLNAPFKESIFMAARMNGGNIILELSMSHVRINRIISMAQ